MGRMSLEIQKRIAPGQNAAWRWIPFTGGPEQRKRTVRAVRDLPVDLDAEGRLLSGAVCTNDPFKAKLHLGVLVVNSDPEFCTTWLASLLRPTDKDG